MTKQFSRQEGPCLQWGGKGRQEFELGYGAV